MIIKVMPRQRATEIDRLIFYVVQPMKAAHVFKSGIAFTETAGSELTALARLNPKCEKPLYHFMVSFTPTEQPENDEIERIVKRVLDELGVTDQMWLAAVHRDTDHLHVHVVMNRISPLTLTALSIRYEEPRLNELARELELEEGWTPTNHRGGSLYAARGSAPRFVERPAFSEWLGYRLRPRMKERLLNPNSTLDDVHALLAQVGAVLEKGARGAIIRDASRPDLVIGASRFMRALSLPNLEQRFGEFHPSKVKPMRFNAYSRQSFTEFERPESLWDAFVEARDAERTLIRNGVGRRISAIVVTRDRRIANERHKATEMLAVAKAIPQKTVRDQYRKRVRTQRDATIAAIRDEARRARRRYSLAPKEITFRQWLYQEASQGNELAIQHLTKIRLFHAQARLDIDVVPPQLQHPTFSAPTRQERAAFLESFFEEPIAL
jgi:hypothetical protein